MRYVDSLVPDPFSLVSQSGLKKVCARHSGWMLAPHSDVCLPETPRAHRELIWHIWLAHLAVAGEVRVLHIYPSVPTMSGYKPLPTFNLVSASRTKAEHRIRTETPRKMQVPLIRLQCGVNSYEWGKSGKESAAAKFAAATPSDITFQDDKPYAEVSIRAFSFSF